MTESTHTTAKPRKNLRNQKKAKAWRQKKHRPSANLLPSDAARLDRLEASMTAMLQGMELAIGQIKILQIRMARHLVESEGAGLPPTTTRGV